MKQLTLSVKQVIGIIIIMTILITVLLIAIGLGLFSISKINTQWQQTLVTTLGNIFGGLIGAFVAYIVAYIQINATLTNEKLIIKQRSNIVLKIILEEVKDNLRTLSCVKDYSEDTQSLLKGQISDIAWKNNQGSLIIENELFENLNAYYRLLNLFMNVHDIAIEKDLLAKMIPLNQKLVEYINGEL